MKKKLKSRRGVTIVEMLVALILLSVLTAGGVSAMTAVMADYNRMQDAANAEILASTAIEAISNEIRLGKDISVDSTDNSLQLGVSAFFGEKTKLTLDTESHLVAMTKDAAGVEKTRQLLSDDTYSGLRLEKLKFEKVEEGMSLPSGITPGRTVFSISFTVNGDYYSKPLWTGEVYAAPMAG